MDICPTKVIPPILLIFGGRSRVREWVCASAGKVRQEISLRAANSKYDETQVKSDGDESEEHNGLSHTGVEFGVLAH